MVREALASELVTAIEGALVENLPFGDSEYILNQLEVNFKRRLDRISARIPSAERLLRTVEKEDAYSRYRVIGNTVIRCAAQHAHTRIESETPYGLPVPECERVFEETINHLEQGKSGTPFENGSTDLLRLGPEKYHGWIWREDYPDNVFGRSFRFILNQEYGEALCTPNDDEIAMLMKGEQLLRTLLPRLERSALGHAHLVGCFPDVGFWKGKVSSSQIRMGGIIFLNRHMLVSPWCIAEHLLHESLHQKLYDFRHGHSLLDPDFTSAESPKVCSLWNAEEFNRANHWDAHRAFAAFHVYVQLALLAIVAEQRASELEGAYGPFCGMVDSRKAFERAYYLGEELKNVCWDELGVAGKPFRDWLMSVLEYLNPSPPPKGATIHLLLDLYQREANKVESVLREGDAARESLSPRLLPIVKEEIDSARHILSSLGAEPELARLNNVVGQFGDDELGAQFPAVRRMIARTILESSADGYRLSPRAPDLGDPDNVVKQMVQRGSERLYLIQTNLPPAVAGAKRRAKDIGFTMSCEDGVGRLLAVLAAAVQSGGMVLEIGTGVGVGLAWITTGLGERTDVEVVSIEVDRRLATAAMVWQWGSNVRILTTDAQEALPMLGMFDLVFIDAAPIKYRRDIDETVRMLRPGGMLVVDDFQPGPQTSEAQLAEKAALRRSLLDHAELQAVELDWSSGVVVATRTRSVRLPGSGIENDVQRYRGTGGEIGHSQVVTTDDPVAQ